MIDTTIFAAIPNDRFVEIAAAALVLVSLTAFLALYPLRPDHPRAAENRDGDRARDRRPQGVHAVFALGGAAVALAGVLSASTTASSTRPAAPLLIFAFIVVVIGGFGLIGGTAVAAVAVGLIQQYANYYASRASATSPSCCCRRSSSCSSLEGLAPKVAH